MLDKKRQLQEEAKKDNTANKFQKNSLTHKIAHKTPLFDLTGKISNQEAGTSKRNDNDTLQHHGMNAKNVENNNSSLIQLSPVSTEKIQLKITENVISESEISNINTTDTAEVPHICTKTSSRNAEFSTCVNEKNSSNDNTENMESLVNPEVSVSDDADIGVLHTFLPVTGEV